MIKSPKSHNVSLSRVDIVRKKAIGAWGERKAIEFLTLIGFTQIKHSTPVNQVYDLDAIDPQGQQCVIEVKTRSPEAITQFFTLRNTKIRNIELFCQHMGIKNVYFILINKFGFKIVSLQQIKEKKMPPDLKIFNFKGHTSLFHSYGGKIGGKREERIEIITSFETKKAFEKIFYELKPELEQKLQRRVVGEDYLLLLIQVYQNYNWVFKEQVNGKPQIR